MKRLKLGQTTPLVQKKDGTIRITGSRVTLDTLVGAFRKGATAEQIQDSYPSPSLRDIYGAIAYYLEHQSGVQEYMRQRRKQAQSLRRNIERRDDTAAFRIELGARRAHAV